MRAGNSNNEGFPVDPADRKCPANGRRYLTGFTLLNAALWQQSRLPAGRRDYLTGQAIQI